jgi:hypothetical protein
VKNKGGDVMLEIDYNAIIQAIKTMSKWSGDINIIKPMRNKALFGTSITVAELIEELKEYPLNANVSVLATDEDGKVYGHAPVITQLRNNNPTEVEIRACIVFNA